MGAGVKPSLFTQLDAVAINAALLKDSPRCWNCGMFRHRERLWLAYRYHLQEPCSRCAVAICELDAKTLQPCGKSQQVQLGKSKIAHYEDPRLFEVAGVPYISYTEMSSYEPGKDYRCVMKYSQLKLTSGRWSVVESWQPRYGLNDGKNREKNWVFFDYEGAIHAVYAGRPNHLVLRLNGEQVVTTYDAPGAMWHFGAFRGGTPPVKQADGTMLSIFHSSLPTEIAPHYIRYYAAAYTFEGEPPFAPLRISTRPLMVGSEEDGHRVDPRYVAGWKPYVVFPCGLVPDGPNWLVSLGVNDWACAVARIKADGLHLGAANGSDIPPRYFSADNGSMPVPIRGEDGLPRHLHWTVVRGRVGRTGTGYMKCANPMEAQAVAEMAGVTEIKYADWDRALAVART
jgi:predicted GH43/DUF377 family glycosyl hydrolase